MSVFKNVFYYETSKGNVGIVRADNKDDASERIGSKYLDDNIVVLECCEEIADLDYGICELFGVAAQRFFSEQKGATV